MNKNYFLIPVGKSGKAMVNFKKTIVKKISIDKIEPFLNVEIIEKFKKHNITSIATWGFRENTAKKILFKMDVNSNVFFVNQKNILGSAKIFDKTVNKDLSREIWDDESFEAIIFLHSVEVYENVSSEYIKNLFKYKKEFSFMGAMCKNQHVEEKMILEYLNKIQEDAKIDVQSFLDDYSKIWIETDGIKLSKYRKEQGWLRKNLLKDKNDGKCIICQNIFPKEFLVAAHIKKRSWCTEEERNDIENIVSLMCVFGCDKLFEEGYIGVDSKGKIIKINNSVHNKFIDEYIDQIKNMDVKDFKESNKKYFEEHKNFHENNKNRLNLVLET